MSIIWVLPLDLNHLGLHVTFACGKPSGRRFTDLTASDLEGGRGYFPRYSRNSSSVFVRFFLFFGFYVSVKHYYKEERGERDKKKEKDHGGGEEESCPSYAPLFRRLHQNIGHVQSPNLRRPARCPRCS